MASFVWFVLKSFKQLFRLLFIFSFFFVPVSGITFKLDLLKYIYLKFFIHMHIYIHIDVDMCSVIMTWQISYLFSFPFYAIRVQLMVFLFFFFFLEIAHKSYLFWAIISFFVLFFFYFIQYFCCDPPLCELIFFLFHLSLVVIFFPDAAIWIHH